MPTEINVLDQDGNVQPLRTEASRSEALEWAAENGYTLPPLNTREPAMAPANAGYMAGVEEAGEVQAQATRRGVADITDDAMNWLRRANPAMTPPEREWAILGQYQQRKDDEAVIARRVRVLEQLGRPVSEDVARSVPELVSGAALGYLIPGRAVTATGRVLREGALSAAMEAFKTSEGDMFDVMMAGAVGGVLGSGLSLALEFPAAWRSMVAPNVKKTYEAFAGSRGAASLDDPFRLAEHSSGRSGISMLPNELGQDPAVDYLMRAIPADQTGPLDAFIRRRAEEAKGRFEDIVEYALPGYTPRPGAGPTEIAASQSSALFNGVQTVGAAWDKATSEIRAGASTAFNHHWRQAESALGAMRDASGRTVGGKDLLDLSNLRRELESQLNAAIEAKAPQAARERIRAEIKALDGTGWSLTGGGFQARLQAAGDEAFGNARAGVDGALETSQYYDARKVWEALKTDLRANSGVMPYDEHYRWGVPGLQARRQAAQSLLAGQGAFEEAIKPLNDLRGSLMDGLMSSVGARTPQEFMSSFMALKPDAQGKVFSMLEAASPEAANAARGVLFGAALQASGGLVRHRDIPLFSLDNFVQVFKGMNDDQRRILLPSGLGPEQRARVVASLEALQNLEGSRYLSTAITKNQGQRLTYSERLSQWAINASIRNGGFISRFAVRELAPHTLAWMLTTRDGINKLLAAGDPKQAKYGALEALINGALENQAMYDAEADRVREEIEAQQRDAQMKMNAPGESNALY